MGMRMGQGKGKGEGEAEKVCYVVVKQAWSGLVRDACSHCDVTIPADATRCPTCGRRIMGR